MTIQADGGLVTIAGDGGGAANDDVAAEQPVPAKEGDAGAAGWDPYDVWLTRVKAPRDDHDKPRTSGHPKKS
jgi:hypothetical protein